VGGGLAGADLGRRGCRRPWVICWPSNWWPQASGCSTCSPSWGARVRLLAAGATNKNDPNDARSVAVAALRSPAWREVAPDDHAAVMKVWSRRHRDLGRTRTQVACRLHAVLCEIVPGGISKAITAAQATKVLERIKPAEPVALARCELAAEFIDDLRRIDAQMRDAKSRLAVTVRASGTRSPRSSGSARSSPPP